MWPASQRCIHITVANGPSEIMPECCAKWELYLNMYNVHDNSWQALRWPFPPGSQCLSSRIYREFRRLHNHTVHSIQRWLILLPVECGRPFPFGDVHHIFVHKSHKNHQKCMFRVTLIQWRKWITAACYAIMSFQMLNVSYGKWEKKKRKAQTGYTHAYIRIQKWSRQSKHEHKITNANGKRIYVKIRWCFAHQP